MSYDVALYDPTFLRSAIASRLGDWTSAPDLGEEVRAAVVRVALAKGFTPQSHPPGFVEFLKSEGATPSEDFRLSTSDLSAQLQVFLGSVAFSVPYSSNATASVQFIRDLCVDLAKSLRLGFHDPQTGEVLYEPV